MMRSKHRWQAGLLTFAAALMLVFAQTGQASAREYFEHEIRKLETEMRAADGLSEVIALIRKPGLVFMEAPSDTHALYSTTVGRYDLRTFHFEPVARYDGRRFGCDDMWVDESTNTICVIEKILEAGSGSLVEKSIGILRLPLRDPSTSTSRSRR